MIGIDHHSFAPTEFESIRRPVSDSSTRIRVVLFVKANRRSQHRRMKLKNICRFQLTHALAAMALVWPGLVAAQTDKSPAVSKQQNSQNQEANVTADGGHFNFYNQTPWFANSGIREQLQLNDKQYNQLNGDYQKSWSDYDNGIRNLDRGLTEEQRQERMNELSNGFQKSFNPALDKSFATAAARQRYNQLNTQYRGYGAFNDPALQQELNLTDVQKKQLQTYDRDWNRKLRKWGPDYADDRETVARELAESRRAASTHINTVLTPEQQMRWKELHGQPYEFTPDIYFPGGSTKTTTLKPVLK